MSIIMFLVPTCATFLSKVFNQQCFQIVNKHITGQKSFLLMLYMRFSQLNFMDIILYTDDNNCTLEIVSDSTSPDGQIQTLTQPVTRTCLQRL